MNVCVGVCTVSACSLDVREKHVSLPSLLGEGSQARYSSRRFACDVSSSASETAVGRTLSDHAFASMKCKPEAVTGGWADSTVWRGTRKSGVARNTIDGDRRGLRRKRASCVRR